MSENLNKIHINYLLLILFMVISTFLISKYLYENKSNSYEQQVFINQISTRQKYLILIKRDIKYFTEMLETLIYADIADLFLMAQGKHLSVKSSASINLICNLLTNYEELNSNGIIDFIGYEEEYEMLIDGLKTCK